MHTDRRSAHTINAVLGDASFIHTFGFPPPPATDERLRISTHLAYVEQILRAAPVQHLASEQRQKRAFLLDKLHEYWQQGRFPKNTAFTHERRPCFIDGEGSICAVGYLVEQDSERAAAERINAHYRYQYVPQMDAPFVQEWMQQSGLSVAECAMIQPRYEGELNNHNNFYSVFRQLFSFRTSSLSTIISFSSIILEEFDTIDKDELREMVYYIDSHAKRVQRWNFLLYMLGEQLYSTHLFESAREERLSVESAKNIIEEDLLYFNPDQFRDITVEIETKGNLSEIAISEYHLKTIIHEILDNAFKFSGGDTPVRVKGRKVGLFYHLAIQDKGIAMEKDMEKKYNLDNATFFESRFIDFFKIEDVHGNFIPHDVMGLFIVKLILNLYDASMTIESTEGEGTTVTLLLPIAAPGT
jgi:signal transduction histidine kinase